MKLKIGLEYSDKTSILSWNFFLKAFRKIFFWTLRAYARYLKGPPNLDLYISKKIKSVRQVFFEISWKTKWGGIFAPPPLQLNSWLNMEMPRRDSNFPQKYLLKMGSFEKPEGRIAQKSKLYSFCKMTTSWKLLKDVFWENWWLLKALKLENFQKASLVIL